MRVTLKELSMDIKSTSIALAFICSAQMGFANPVQEFGRADKAEQIRICQDMYIAFSEKGSFYEIRSDSSYRELWEAFDARLKHGFFCKFNVKKVQFTMQAGGSWRYFPILEPVEFEQSMKELSTVSKMSQGQLR